MAAPSAARATSCSRCGKPNCDPCLRSKGCERWREGLCKAFFTHRGEWLCWECKVEVMKGENNDNRRTV